jgi:hypothetical protein
MQAILIDSMARLVRPIDYRGGQLQELVGGWIEIGHRFDTGDILFVDEEGLMKPQVAWFRLTGKDQPMAGNGVIVGPEVGDTIRTMPPRITVDQVRDLIRFLTREQVMSWAKGNASEPAVTETALDRDFRPIGPTSIVARLGSVFGDMPEPRRARYEWTVGDGLIAITDLSGLGDAVLSVTNDIENILADITAAGIPIDQHVVFYRDTTGQWDAVRTKHRRFDGFVILQKPTLQAAVTRYQEITP